MRSLEPVACDMTGILITGRRGTEGETWGEEDPCDDRGKDWSIAASSQGPWDVYPQKLVRGKNSTQSLRGDVTQKSNTLISDL